jgi:hypothetical protein
MGAAFNSFRKLIADWFRSRTAKRQATLADNENFVALVRAAQGDLALRQTVLGMASIESDFHRESLISEYQRDLLQRGAPRELVEAFGFLRDAAVAEKLKELLR